MGSPVDHNQVLEETTALFGRAARLLDPLRLRVWEEMGITFPQLRILFTVREQPGSDLRTLAERLGIGTSGASQQVDRLVEKGFLARTEDADDRRRLRLGLTARGVEAAESISVTARDYERQLLTPLTDEQLHALSAVLTDLIAAATAHPPHPTIAPEPAHAEPT